MLWSGKLRSGFLGTVILWTFIQKIRLCSSLEMSQLSVIIDWKDLCLFSITMEEVGTKSQVRLFTLLMKVKNTKKIHDAVSDFHLVWYFTVLFDWTYVGYPVRKLVRLTIICVLWSKRSRMQKTYLKLFKHFQWSVYNVALDPLVTSNASTMWCFPVTTFFCQTLWIVFPPLLTQLSAT